MIDQGQGGSRIVKENRKVEWKILITGNPRPQVTWSKGTVFENHHKRSHLTHFIILRAKRA